MTGSNRISGAKIAYGVDLSGGGGRPVAFDRGRDDWRTFRVDRTSRLLRTGVRDPRREVPGVRMACEGQEQQSGEEGE